ncbi:hypothetical protein AB5J62_43655 [Amycolatopsis sp. cg5]|uniref:hypothetical protein n=1 Tax=Amycolatopsis sp. cg5 TaxID=3238802 RepID=UPI003526ABA2
MTYAIENSQSHHVMRNYKGEINVDELRSRVAMLYFLGISLHTACASKLSRTPITHWTTVPSLPAKPGEHPLHAILTPFMRPLIEVPLLAARQTAAPRRFSADHFRAMTSVPHGSHVLVIDDTWVRGGHAQSAAHSVRQAGASTVSILNGARYLRGKFGDNAQFIKAQLSQDYEPLVCPWTGENCP